MHNQGKSARPRAASAHSDSQFTPAQNSQQFQSNGTSPIQATEDASDAGFSTVSKRAITPLKRSSSIAHIIKPPDLSTLQQGSEEETKSKARQVEVESTIHHKLAQAAEVESMQLKTESKPKPRGIFRGYDQHHLNPHVNNDALLDMSQMGSVFDMRHSQMRDGQTVQLFVEARNLADLDIITMSDPFCALKVRRKGT